MISVKVVFLFFWVHEKNKNLHLDPDHAFAIPCAESGIPLRQ